MSRDNGEVRERKVKKVKQVAGDKAKLAKLRELKKVDAEITKRFKVSEKLFERKDKLRRELGI